MGQTILFPNDQEREAKLGKLSFEKGDYQKAQEHFETAYAKNPSYELNRQINRCLEKKGEFHRALVLAEEYQEEYDRDPEGFHQLFHLYLLDQQFLMARKYWRFAKERDALATVDFEQAEQELTQLEQVLSFYEPESLHQKREYLLKANDSLLPLPNQKWAELITGLPYASFVTIAKEILAKAYNPYLRPRLVEELVKLGYQKELLIQDVKGRKQNCRLRELALPEQNPALFEMLDYLEANYSQADPVLLDSIKAEVKAHFALAYPFCPQVLAPKDWAESYWVEYQVALGTEGDFCLEEFSNIQLEKQELRNLLQIQL